MATNVLGGLLGKSIVEADISPMKLFTTANRYLALLLLLLVFNWSFFIQTLKHLPLNVVSPLATMFTVLLTVILSTLIFREHLSGVRIVGIAISLIGGAIIMYSR